MAKQITAKLFVAAVVLLILLASDRSLAQQSTSAPAKQPATPSGSAPKDSNKWTPDQSTLSFSQDLKSQKKQMVAANMNLTDAEAEKFWPVYDRYAADLTKIYDTKLTLVDDYFANYQTMNGDEAETYIRRRAQVENDIMQLRLKYVPEFRKILSGRQTALFYQIEWRLDLMINLQLAQAPVINP
jgi:hypothetical protein